jgi:transcriptional regulator with XRE-family HTH domain
MAEKLNVSQPAYAGFENSDNMRLGTLQKIVTALGGELSLRVLIDGYEYDLQKPPQMALV